MLSIKAMVAVALGGALGAVARYLSIMASTHLFGYQFPYGTLFVNIFGSFLMGLLVEAMALVWTVGSELRLFLLVGVLGAFTTFSTFSLDIAILFERGRILATVTYMMFSVLLSIAALCAGMALLRRLLAG